jgi:HD superfamily phosphodiesterase
LYDPSTIATATAALPPSADAYAGGGESNNTINTKKQDTVAHFYEKLLHLKDRMRTAEGRRMAGARHAFMEAYLAQLRAEVAQEL